MYIIYFDYKDGQSCKYYTENEIDAFSIAEALANFPNANKVQVFDIDTRRFIYHYDVNNLYPWTIEEVEEE